MTYTHAELAAAIDKARTNRPIYESSVRQIAWENRNAHLHTLAAMLDAFPENVQGSITASRIVADALTRMGAL